MKRILALLLVCLLACSFVACDQTKEKTPEATQNGGKADAPYYTVKLDAATEQTDFVQIEMQNGATIVIALYPEFAPETVANFKSLVASGFYNGLTFHRLVEGFVIQGGCPNGNGTGSTTPIKGEFASNGFEQNTLAHERGVVSMARRTDPNSGSCQFFIMHDAAPHLDGDYAAFGRVVAGMETVDYLATLPNTAEYYADPTPLITMRSVTFVNYVAE